MTGTSLDAIDVAVCDIVPSPLAGHRPSVHLVHFAMLPYPADVLDAVEALLATAVPIDAVSACHMALARAYADAVRQVVDPTTVDAIGLHGQTVWHAPPGHTLQLGSGTALAALLGRTVVHDFRTTDVARGGQGAPLVPLFDWAMLTHTTDHVVALNIGGMANVTSLPPSTGMDGVVAFDTGPGNILIDAAMRFTFGKRRDDDGAFARSGRVLPAMLAALQADPYFEQRPPKSTGREHYNDAMVEALIKRYHHPSAPSEDVVTTVTELTAWSIADQIERFLPTASRVVASGGGIHNGYLMERLALALGERRLERADDHGLPSDAKEAMCFAWLAWRTLASLPGNLPSVTGADAPLVLGSIAPAP